MTDDILRRLAGNSQAALDDGTYEIDVELCGSELDMLDEIRSSTHAALITEIKFESPSEGRLRTEADPAAIAARMIAGGARALSVLTQPRLFGGSPGHFASVRQAVSVPMLMKDIIVDTRQIDAARRMGADYILLIKSIFEHGYASDADVDAFVDYAHRNGLGVLLEVHTTQEYMGALQTEADIIGINNRNLDTLRTDVGTTGAILSECPKDRPVVSESGIAAPEDIVMLHGQGADAFLVGSSIMKSSDIEGTVRGLVQAY